jgi:LmbE family N-acetylglucosaminyl deacetylase
MASLARAGCLFHTIFVTDGGASHPHSRAWRRDRLAAQREQEAAAALACLGLAHHPRTFLRLRDAQMPNRSSCRWRAAITTLCAIIKTRQGIGGFRYLESGRLILLGEESRQP